MRPIGRKNFYRIMIVSSAIGLIVSCIFASLASGVVSVYALAFGVLARIEET